MKYGMNISELLSKITQESTEEMVWLARNEGRSCQGYGQWRLSSNTIRDEDCWRIVRYVVLGKAKEDCGQSRDSMIIASVGGFCDELLYYYDQPLTILENFHAEMAEKFSFDLRRIKKKKLFFGCDNDVNDWS